MLRQQTAVAPLLAFKMQWVWSVNGTPLTAGLNPRLRRRRWLLGVASHWHCAWKSFITLMILVQRTEHIRWHHFIKKKTWNIRESSVKNRLPHREGGRREQRSRSRTEGEGEGEDAVSEKEFDYGTFSLTQHWFSTCFSTCQHQHKCLKKV